MATRIMESEFQPKEVVEEPTRPALRLVRSDDPYAELERPASPVAGFILRCSLRWWGSMQ